MNFPVIRTVVALVFAATVSGCVSPTGEIAGRARLSDSNGVAVSTIRSTPEVRAARREYRVTNLKVDVPLTLQVSEANSYKPNADIVWHGDAYGDRYTQVKTVMFNGLVSDLNDVRGRRPVNVEIKVIRFHALTQRTRYTIGGSHEIKFIVSVTDRTTGELAEAPWLVNATFEAYGGDRAIEAERQGLTQKIRIQSRLSEVIRHEFGLPARADVRRYEIFVN